MKWIYGIQHKFAASVLLALVLGLVMWNNLMERNQIRRLDKSFGAMYEDRLLAESYLFQLYDQLQQKNELFLIKVKGIQYSRDEFDFAQYQQKLDAIIHKYEKTHLTKEESLKYQRFKDILTSMKTIDAQIMAQQREHQGVEANLIANCEAITTKAFVVLGELSEIQTSEGQALRSQSKRIVLGNMSSSYFEMTMLVIIALLIQALVFSSKTLQVSKTQNSNLN